MQEDSCFFHKSPIIMMSMFLTHSFQSQLLSTLCTLCALKNRSHGDRGNTVFDRFTVKRDSVRPSMHPAAKRLNDHVDAVMTKPEFVRFYNWTTGVSFIKATQYFALRRRKICF